MFAVKEISKLMKALNWQWKKQRKRARESSGFGTDYNELIKVDSRSDFLSGYDHNEQQGTIDAIFHNGQNSH